MLCQLALVKGGPLENEPPSPRGSAPTHDFYRINPDHSPVLAVGNMEVERRMVRVKHADPNPVELGNPGHSFTSSTPTEPVTRAVEPGRSGADAIGAAPAPPPSLLYFREYAALRPVGLALPRGA